MKLVSALPFAVMFLFSLVPQMASASQLRAGLGEQDIESTATSTTSRSLWIKTWYGPDETSGITTWEQAKSFCEGKGKELGSFSDYCPRSGGPPPVNLPEPSFTPKAGDEWAPMRNHPNAWVQVGSSGHATCARHREEIGSDPDWGISTDKKPFEANYVMCGEPERRYLVIVQGGIKGDEFSDLEQAKAKLHQYSRGSRMIAEIKDGWLQTDPHTINGIAQTPENGFRKYWHDWNDINSMLTVARNFMASGTYDKDRGNQCWDDGTVCVLIISCSSCCNPDNWWWSKVAQACGAP